MNKLIVVSQPEKWPIVMDNTSIITSQDYLIKPEYTALKNARVFNLSDTYTYQSKGYYVSLLAEARGHISIPTISNLVDLGEKKLVKIVSEDFEEEIQKSLKTIKSQEFTLSIYFGQNVAQKYRELSTLIFRYYQIPFLRVIFKHTTKWNIKSIKAISLSEIPKDHLESMHHFASQYFSKKRYDTLKIDKSEYDLAILVQKNDPAPPSNPKALKKFMDVAEKMNFYVELIYPEDLYRLSSFDALFIRQSTEVNNEAYTFARKALQDGLAIVDYPDAILKCCNKVFMAEALNKNGISTPKTMIVHKDNTHEVLKYTGLPCVLKSPDSTFSFGVKKAKTEEEYETLITEMFKTSDLIIAQEYTFSEYDWRIGIIDSKPFYACRYFMAKGHWQIYNWTANKKGDQDGNADCIAVEEVPEPVIKAALKSAKIMGKGLYGIDVKEVDGKALVIEINDNPNIDFGVEDGLYGDAVYTTILQALKNRLNSKQEL
ncbi:RimK family protein [Psychroflexus sediminis]|nr:RimK family protein [Psychroflexus sediminis]